MLSVNRPELPLVWVCRLTKTAAASFDNSNSNRCATSDMGWRILYDKGLVLCRTLDNSLNYPAFLQKLSPCVGAMIKGGGRRARGARFKTESRFETCAPRLF